MVPGSSSRKQNNGKLPAMEKKKLRSRKVFNYNFSINEFTQFEYEELPKIFLGLQHVSVSKKPPLQWGRKGRRSAISVSPPGKVDKVSSLSPKTPLLFNNSDDDGGGSENKNIARVKAEIPAQMGFLVPPKCLMQTEELSSMVSTELTLGPVPTQPINAVDRPIGIGNPTAMMNGQYHEFRKGGLNFDFNLKPNANSALARKRRYEINKEKKSLLSVRLRVATC